MRRFIAVASATALLTTSAACANTGATKTSAQQYPSQPITIIVGYAAGGSTDTGARVLAKELEKRLDTTITVKNRPGANAQIAYTALSQSAPNGSTIGTINFPSAIITVLDESRGASYTRDSFAPVALQVVDPTAVAVAPDSPLQGPQDLVQTATAQPNKISVSTTGVASNEHFAALLLEQRTDAKLAPVHFAEGGQRAKTAFLGGDVDVYLGNVGDLKPLIESGKARPIGVMADQRSPFLPKVPTFAEKGYDVSIASSRGYAFPAKTPDEIVTKMSNAIGKIMKDKKFRARMKDLGLAPVYMDPKEYAQYWRDTTQLFKELMPLVRGQK